MKGVQKEHHKEITMEKDEGKKGRRFAVDTNHMAEVRTSLASSRTYLAAERTFAAWIRTGFNISGVGVTVGTALKDTQTRWISWTIAVALTSVGIFSFIYGWYQYKSVYHYIKSHFTGENLSAQSFSFNYHAMTIITVILVLASLMGIFLMFS